MKNEWACAPSGPAKNGAYGVQGVHVHSPFFSRNYDEVNNIAISP